MSLRVHLRPLSLQRRVDALLLHCDDVTAGRGATLSDDDLDFLTSVRDRAGGGRTQERAEGWSGPAARDEHSVLLPMVCRWRRRSRTPSEGSLGAR